MKASLFLIYFCSISISSGLTEYIPEECGYESLNLSDSCSARTGESFSDALTDRLRDEVKPALILINMSIPHKKTFIRTESGMVITEFGELLLNIKAELDFLDLSLPILNEHTFYLSFTMIVTPSDCSNDISEAVIERKMQNWYSCLTRKHNQHLVNSLPIKKLCFPKHGDWFSFLANPFRLYPDFYFYECCNAIGTCENLSRLDEPLWLKLYVALLNYGVTLFVSFINIIAFCCSMQRKIDNIQYRPKRPIIWKTPTATNGTAQTKEVSEVCVNELNSQLIAGSNFSLRTLIQLAFNFDKNANRINALALVLYVVIVIVFKILFGHFEVNTAVCLMSFGDLIISICLFLGIAMMYTMCKGRQACLSIYSANRGTISFFFHTNIIFIIVFRNALVIAVATVLESTANAYTLVAAATLSVFVNGYYVLKRVHREYCKFLRMCLETITSKLRDNTSPTVTTYRRHLIAYSVDDNVGSCLEQGDLGNLTLVLNHQISLFYLDNGQPAISKLQFHRLCESKICPAPGRLSRSICVAFGKILVLVVSSLCICSLIHQFTQFSYNSFISHVMIVLAGLFPCFFILPFMSSQIDMTSNITNFIRDLKLMVKQNLEIYQVDETHGCEGTPLFQHPSNVSRELQDYIDEDSNRLL